MLSCDQPLQRRIARERAAAESQLLHGLIKEALRLYPVAPFIGRYMPQDTQIGGHYVEKDVSCPQSLYTLRIGLMISISIADTCAHLSLHIRPGSGTL